MNALEETARQAIERGTYEQLPDHTSLSTSNLSLVQLWAYIQGKTEQEQKKNEFLQCLIILETTFRAYIDREEEPNEDEIDAAASLLQWIANASLPDSSYSEELELIYLPEEDKPTPTTNHHLDNFRFTVGLKALNINPGCRLHRALTTQSTAAIVRTAATFVTSNTPWTTPHLRSLANDIIQTLTPPPPNSLGTKLSTAIKSILQTQIRPIFARAPNPHVTPSGRKAAYHQPESKWTSLEYSTDASLKPWKHDAIWAVPIVSWIVSQFGSKPGDVDKDKIQEEIFLLLTPPILNLIDDASMPYKVQGCRLLLQLLQHLSSSSLSDVNTATSINIEAQSSTSRSGIPQRTPPLLLRRTGLDSVFHEALMSCTSHLPTLTPDASSAALLSQTYAALFALDSATTTFPPSSSSSSRPLTIISKAIIPSLHHVSTPHDQAHPLVTTTLVSSLRPFLSSISLDSVRYLHDLIPLFNSLLTHPFATTTPELLLAVLDTYGTLIKACAPRIAAHYTRILVGPCGCWYRIRCDEGSIVADRDNGGQTNTNTSMNGNRNGDRDRDRDRDRNRSGSRSRRRLKEVEEALRRFVKVLGDTVDSSAEDMPNGKFEADVKLLVRENGWLDGLFSFVVIDR